LGPGTYDPRFTLTRERSPEAFITGATSPEHRADNPGPGEYNDITPFGEGAIKVSIHPKIELPLNNRNPGPGAYKPLYTQV
jgi:Sperm-tail PG-rich repeat